MPLLLKHFTFIAIFCVLLCAILFYDGLPMGHDYPIQISAYEAVKTQVMEGELYPRWLSDINNGFGGMNLFFYPPLIYANYLMIDFLTLFTFSVEWIICLGATLTLILSGFAFYAYGRSVTSPKNSLIISLLYVSLPYHLSFEIFVRNAHAELLAYIWVPLLFLCIEKIRNNEHKYLLLFAPTYTFMILSHIPSALIIGIFIALYSLLLCLKFDDFKSKLQFLYTIGLSGLIGTGLAGFYLYPALSLIEHMNTWYLWGSHFSYKIGFLGLWNCNGCTDDILHNALPIFLICQIISVTFIIGYLMLKKQIASSEHVWNYGILLIFCAFMMTPFSLLIWEIVTPLQKIQFPWRLFILFDFFYLSIILYLLKNMKLRLFSMPMSFLMTAHIIFIAVGGLSAYKINNDITRPRNEILFEKSLSAKFITAEHTTNSANLTLNVDEFLDITPPPLLQSTSTETEIELTHHKPRDIAFSVHSQEQTQISVRQFHFIGWRLFSDNIDITETSNLRDSKPFGQIIFELPQGQHNLSLRLIILPEERIGIIISLISFLCFLITALIYTRKKREL